MPDKTVEPWRNLWLHTGDRLIRSPVGYFRFVDRLKDTIRRRGENVPSYEVEQVLLTYPAIGLAPVYPVSSELAEDEVMAAIVLEDRQNLSESDVIRFCEGKISYFAIPEFIELLRSFQNLSMARFRNPSSVSVDGLRPTGIEGQQALN